MSKILFDRKYRGKAIFYMILKFVNAGLLLLPPYCYMVFLDEVITKQRLNRLPFVLAAYVAVFLAKTAVSVWNKQVYNRIFPEITMDYKMKVLEKYSELDIPVISEYTPGELQERVHKDTENVSEYCLKKIDINISIISILVTTVILLYLNWIMAVVSFLLLPLSIWITRYIRGKSNVEYERKRQLQGKYNDFMINNLFFWKEIKSGCIEEKQQKQFESYWDQMGTAFIKSHICWFMNRTFLAFKDVFLTKMGLYLLGGILVIYGMATVPVLLTFMEYYADFTNRILEVADLVIKLGEQEESVKRVYEILSLPQSKQLQPQRQQALPEQVKSQVQVTSPEQTLPSVQRVDIGHFESLSIQNVGFSYSTRNEKVLENFSLEVHKGDSVAIIGESGCGKSTLIKIMAGCLNPQNGTVLWNGHRMEEIHKKSLYPKVGFLMQDAGLFNLTIRENMQFGKKDASDQEILEACRRANILDFVQGLPQGIETVIGENGIRLSGGQRQRLQIARLFLQNPEVIVFDEATSALDYGNESKILNLLLNNMEDKTFIMVTHRGTSVARCNRVVEINRPLLSHLSP